DVATLDEPGDQRPQPRARHGAGQPDSDQMTLGVPSMAKKVARMPLKAAAMTKKAASMPEPKGQGDPGCDKADRVVVRRAGRGAGAGGWRPATFRTHGAWRILSHSKRRGAARINLTGGIAMAKGLDKKKEQKKKPAKSLKEKRAEKNDKKAGKAFMPT
ncbi:MAG TPA: hypothetical protein VJ484_08125, partial [Lysobacter sp.]|nr:hypothetical protein [Lysobacter sp.]